MTAILALLLFGLVLIGTPLAIAVVIWIESDMDVGPGPRRKRRP